jgi:hypothetical protein
MISALTLFGPIGWRENRLRNSAPATLYSGQAWTIVARARPQDEVVVTTDSAVYLVHLTWTSRPERPSYPSALAFQSAAAFEDANKYRY